MKYKQAYDGEWKLEMLQLIEERLPQKETFRPAELARFLSDVPGFSRSNLFRKIFLREIPSERTSERGIVIYRAQLIAYFRNIQ